MNEVMKRVKEMTDKGVLHSGNLFLLTTLLYIETLKDRDDPTRMSMNADLETLLREPSPAHYEQWWGGTDREGLRIIAALLYEKSRAAATPSQQDQLKKFYEDPEAREKLSGSRASLLNDFSGLGDPSLLNDFVALALKLDPSQNSLFSRYDVFMKSARDAKTTPAAIRAYMEAVSYIFSQVQLVRQQKSEVENMASSTNGEILQYLLSHFFAAAPLKAVFDVYFNPLNDSARREIERYDLRADKPDPAAFYESLADGYLDMHKRHNRKLDHIFFVPFMEYFVTDDSRVLPEGELFFRIFTLKMLRDKRSIKERLRRKIDALDTYPEEMRIPLFRKLLGLLERQWDVAEKKDNELEKKSIGGKYAAMSIAVDIVRGSELIAKLAAPAYRGRLLSATEELALKTAVQEKIDEAAAADGQEFDAKQKELEKALQMFDRFQEKKLIADLRKRFKAILGRTMSRSIFDALILYAAKFTRQVDQYNFYEVLMEYVENIKGNKEAVKTIYQALIKEIRGKYKDWRYRSPEYLKMFEQYRAFAGKMKWRRKDTKAKIEKIKKNWENNRQYEFTGQDGKKYYMGFTDNLPVLMNLGNPAEFDSCLATYRKNNSYTAGLGGYVANGGNKAMVVFDEDGQFVSRRVVRLRYTGANEFVLLSEKRYGSGTFDEHLEQLLGSVARDMGVRYQTYKDEEGEMTDLDINLWGGHSIWDYSDLYGNQQQRENAGFLTIYPGQHFTVNIKVPLKTAGTASLKEDYKGISENSFLKVAINRDDFQSPGVSAAQATVSLSRHSAARDGTKDAGETGEYRIERLNYAEASPAQKEKIDHELYKIHESIDWTFRHEAVMELMEDPRFTIYVAKNADDEIIGYHMYEIVKGEDPEEPLIGRGQFLAVLKRYHKEKIGKALVLKGIQELQKMKIKRWYYNYDPLRPKEFHETMKKHLPFVEEKDQRFMRLTYTIAGVKTGRPQTGAPTTYPSSSAAVIAAFDLLKEVLDDIENVSVQTARAVKSLLADMASGRGGAGTLLDWHYLESGDLAEAIDTFGTVIEDSNGDMHAGMYILGRRTAAMDAWEWEPTGIRVDENMVWASTKAGAVVLYADNVQPERIAAAVNGELLMKGRLAGSRKGVERFKTLIGAVAGNRIDLEGTAFKAGIVVDHRTQDKKRAYSASGNPVVPAGYFAADGRPEQETIAARYGELMHERHADAVAMAQSFFVRLDGIRSIEEFKANLDAFLLTGNMQMIAFPEDFAGVSDRVLREITGLAASSGVKIYIEPEDTEPATLASYQGKGFAGYALTGDGTVTVYDYLSNTAGIEADTIQGYTDPAGLNDKLQASRRPYKVLNLSELKNLMEGGQRDILDRVALTEMLKTTILSFYNGPTLTPEYVQRAGEAWDRDRLPPLSDDLTALKKAAISGKPDELIAAMGIKDIEHPVKRYLDKLDVEDRDTAVQLQQAYLTAITGRMLARAVLDAAEKRQGLADPELEIILGRKLVQQLRQNTADAGIDESFLQVEKAKDSDTTVKFYERLKDTVRALNSRTNDPKAINTIIQLIPLHAEQRMSIRIEQPQTNFDTKAINKLLSAA
jgi:GNAT superfamily N-acetyltransferase